MVCQRNRITRQRQAGQTDHDLKTVNRSISKQRYKSHASFAPHRPPADVKKIWLIVFTTHEKIRCLPSLLRTREEPRVQCKGRTVVQQHHASQQRTRSSQLQQKANQFASAARSAADRRPSSQHKIIDAACPPNPVTVIKIPPVCSKSRCVVQRGTDVSPAHAADGQSVQTASRRRTHRHRNRR